MNYVNHMMMLNSGDGGFNDPLRASFFDMFWQNQLQQLLPPAFTYSLDVLAMRNERWRKVAKYGDELFLALQLLIEHLSLKYYEGSFAENFYNLRRSAITMDARPTTTSNKPTDKRKPAFPTLSFEKRMLSLIFLAVVPYLKRKADKYFSDLQESDNNSNGNEVASWFVKYYPYINAIYEGTFFAFQILYMHDYTRFFSFSLYITGLEVKLMPMQYLMNLSKRKAEQKERMLNSIEAFWSKRGLICSLIGLFLRFGYRVFHVLLDYSHFWLQSALFVFKVLEWWYANESNNTTTSPIPPPPPKPTLKRAASGISLPSNKKHCPICRDSRVNAAMLTTSGFVFCYQCIHNHVSERATCPITLAPSDTSHILKLYEPGE